MRFSQYVKATASVAVLAVVTGAAVAAEAQEAPRTVDEIVVTAQKREQNLQDVPIVVTALPQKLLQDTGVKDIKDLTILTPGLTVTSTTSEASTTARIRGVGTVGDNPGLESSVGVVIDGVYRPRNGVSFGDLGEMQRIEVLKGPQGTLFGKNTSAGVISIITKEPEFTFGGNAELTAGNYGAVGGSVSVTGPIVQDVAAGRLYFAARKRDGFNDVVNGKGPSTTTEDADQNFWTIRGQVLFTPSSDVSIKFIADYTKRDENCCAAVQIRTGPTAAIINALAAPSTGLSIYPNPSARKAYSNRAVGSQVEDGGVSAEANVDLPFGKLTSVTAVRRWETKNGQDSDFTTADITYRQNDGTNYSRFTTISQELRLAGQVGKVDWLVGGFFAGEQLSNGANFLYGSDYEKYLSMLLSGGNPNFIAGLNGRAPGTSFAAGQGLYDHYTQESKTYALFTNDTWHVTEKLDLTVGLRWTSEDKSLNTSQSTSDGSIGCATAIARQAAGAWTALGIPLAAQPTILGNMCLPWANPLFNGRANSQSLSSSEWSGTAKVAYRWSPEVMTYASYARGYKGAGFNLDRTQSSNGLQSGLPGIMPIYDTSFPAEFVDSYELGAKTTLLDRSLLLNAALFYQKFTDFQLNTFLGTSFAVRSIPEVESKGVDIDLLWFTPVQGLSVQGGLTYADTTYGDQKIPNDPTNALALLPGSRLSFAPEWSGSASVTYETPVSDMLKARFNIGAKYTSDYNTGSDLFPPKMQKAFTLFNARAGLSTKDDRWTVEVWAQNLFDQEYKQVVFNGPLQGSSGLDATHTTYDPTRDTITYDAFLGAPRTYGVTLRAKF